MADGVDLPLRARQGPGFGTSPAERAKLEQQIDGSLAGVVRVGEPRFDLRSLLDDFDALWGTRPCPPAA